MNKYIDDYLKKFEETGEVGDENSEIFRKINDGMTSILSPYVIEDIRKVNDVIEENDDEFHYVVHVHCGDNGNGNWSDYLIDISKLVIELENTFDSAYIISIENDCPDDVHEILIGIY